VTRAFRNLAIVSLQFRPLLTTWIFTVVVPADKISWTILPSVTRCRAGSAMADLLFSAPNRQSQSKTWPGNCGHCFRR
jgi:Flp pilus assembly CpaE family ATPase